MRVSAKTEAISRLCFEDRSGEWQQVASLKLNERKIVPFAVSLGPISPELDKWYLILLI